MSEHIDSIPIQLPVAINVSNSEDNLDNAKAVIENLFHKYKDDPYMMSKMQQYVCNQLPNVLDNMKQTHEFRIQRSENVTREQRAFIESFLSTNSFFYVPTTERYFFYDGKQYQVYSEDKILHEVLTTISRDRNLLTWKHKTKQDIMKKIRENSLLKTIPESETIQVVIGALFPTLFSTRTEAKYFLTVLGDNILKPANSIPVIHFVDAKAKHFIKDLNTVCQHLIGTGLSNTFKYKFHAHEFANSRLIKINDCVTSQSLCEHIIASVALDILCVACHYSVRYGSSDSFVENYGNDFELQARVFYLRDTNPEEMVSKFINEYLQISTSSIQIFQATQVQTKDMLYLWKHFLDAKGLPAIMFQNTLKTHLIDKLKVHYNEELDSFVGVSSQFMPDVKRFLHFWKENMHYDDSETDLEIEEVHILFKRWSTESIGLTDKQILDIIMFFFPDVEIDKNKYIHKYGCVLWDKHADIHNALESMKVTLRNQFYTAYNRYESHEEVDSPLEGHTLSICDAYKYYCRYTSALNEGHLIASKSYFDKYIFENLYRFVNDSKFIAMEWIVEP